MTFSRIFEVYIFSFIPSGKQGSVTVLDSNDVSVTLHFTENQPREDVAVVVVSVVSRNYQPITNYVLQAVVPKVRRTDVREDLNCAGRTCNQFALATGGS